MKQTKKQTVATGDVIMEKSLEVWPEELENVYWARTEQEFVNGEERVLKQLHVDYPNREIVIESFEIKPSARNGYEATAKAKMRPV